MAGPAGDWVASAPGIWAWKYAIDGLKRMLNWDAVTLKGLLDTRGEQIEAIEFDYKGVNQVIVPVIAATATTVAAFLPLTFPQALHQFGR